MAINFQNLVDGNVLSAALSQFKLKMEGKISELAFQNEDQVKSIVMTALAEITGEGELPEAFDTIQEIGTWIEEHQDVYETLKAIVDEVKGKDVVLYTDTHNDDNPDRKSIVLENNYNILGKETDGTNRNLLVLSPENTVEVGSPSVGLNLNGSEDRPTYKKGTNESKAIALYDDIDARIAAKFPDLADSYVTTTQLETELEKYTTTEDLEANYVKVDELNALAMTEQQAKDMVNEIFNTTIE